MIHVLADLGFGDAGKGLFTDYLVRHTGARLVVRYNGGAQAGHNVVAPDGRHHTFAQVGAGSFVPGVRTFLSRHVVVHPTALLAELAALAAKGVGDLATRLRISERALVITPFHQAAGRLRELARGAARHGSCGAGVGEAVRDALRWPDDAITAADLGDHQRLRRKAARGRERMQAEIEALQGASGHSPWSASPAGASGAETTPGGPTARAAGEPLGAAGLDAEATERAAREGQILADGSVVQRWAAAAESIFALGLVAPDPLLGQWLGESDGSAVFEGAQGVLLDEWAGFHPHTAWSRCTFHNAEELLAEAAPGAAVRRIGVLRSHAVRHGAGPLPTETTDLHAVVREHNRHGEWQGAVRYGWFDSVLARYALEAAGAPLDGLVMTHLDAVARGRRWAVCGSYNAANEPQCAIAMAVAGSAPGATAPAARAAHSLVGELDSAGCIVRLATPPGQDLDRQAALTALLARASPVLEGCEPAPDAALAAAERLLGRTFDWVSRGPRASDVEARRPP